MNLVHLRSKSLSPDYLRRYVERAFKVVLWLLVIGLVGCDKPDQSPVRKRIESRVVVSTDKVLSVTLPTALWLHTFSMGIEATHPAGRFRYFFGHLPPDKLIRIVGQVKDVLAKKGWRVAEERHFKEAVQLELERGGISGEPKEMRRLWYVRSAGRVLVCDGIADTPYKQRLEKPFKTLCGQCELTRLEEPPKPSKKAKKAVRGKAKSGNKAAIPRRTMKKPTPETHLEKPVIPVDSPKKPTAAPPKAP